MFSTRRNSGLTQFSALTNLEGVIGRVIFNSKGEIYIYIYIYDKVRRNVFITCMHDGKDRLVLTNRIYRTFDFEFYEFMMRTILTRYFFHISE